MIPRRTVRLRLTLVYGGLFLLSGAALLAITYALVSRQLPAITTARHGTGGLSAATLPANVSRNARACFFGQRAGPGKPPFPASLPLPAGSPSTSCLNAAKLISQQRAAEMDRLLTVSGIALAIMTVVSIGLGWLVAGRALRPLRTITAAVKRISASNLHERLALRGPDDELKELGGTFDELLGRLQAAFAAQRQFVANASHELRTPLARQRTVMEVALADPARSATSLQRACERALAAGEQQERLIEALLTLASSQRGLDRRERFDLAELTGAAARSRRGDALARGVSVTTTLGGAEASGDARLAERLVANLLDNAVRHNAPGGWVSIVTETQQGQAVLSVANGGPVIAPGDVARLFEPFQRLAPERTGRDSPGLGLSIVSAIARAHGAQVRARPLAGGGLEIQVRFPGIGSTLTAAAPAASTTRRVPSPSGYYVTQRG